MTDVINPDASPAAAGDSAATRENTAPEESTSVAVSPIAASVKVLKVLINSIVVGESKPDESFYVVLDPSKHGLFDVIQTAFDEFNAKKWTYDQPYSHLYTCVFAGKHFVGQKYLPPDLLEHREYVCNEQERRIFDSESMEDILGPVHNGMKGWFRFDQRDLSFKFAVEASIKAADHEEYKAAVEKPMCVAIESSSKYTDGKDTDYLTVDECNAVVSLSEKYTAYFDGNNSWKSIRGIYPREWQPAKPKPFVWGGDEIEIMALFINGGWKFAASWKYGLQYAFPHRTKAATQGKWYDLIKKHPYMLEYPGRKLTKQDKILRAKKLCKAMMQERIDQGAPKPEPKPKRSPEEAMFLRSLKDDDSW